MAKKTTSPVKAEVIMPKVDTQAAVQIQLSVEDGVDPIFVRAKHQTRVVMTRQIAAAKAKRAEAAEARSAFQALIDKFDDPIVVKAVGAHQAAIGAALRNFSNAYEDMVSSPAGPAAGDYDHDDDDAPAYDPAGVERLAYNEAKRTRTFRVKGVADNAKGKDLLSSYEMGGRNAASAKLVVVFTVPMSDEQSAALGAAEAATRAAEELEADVARLQQYRSVELPQLRELAVAEAKDRWLSKAEGADAIYDADFKSQLASLFDDAIARTGLPSQTRKQLAAR